MSDSDENPLRHNSRWTDQHKTRVIQLRRSGKTYQDIATTMGRTKNSVKAMCERLERTQFQENQKWNAQFLKINAQTKRNTTHSIRLNDDDEEEEDEDEDDDITYGNCGKCDSKYNVDAMQSCDSCESYYCDGCSEFYGDTYSRCRECAEEYNYHWCANCDECCGFSSDHDCTFKACDRCEQRYCDSYNCFESIECEMCEENICKLCGDGVSFCSRCEAYLCKTCLWNITSYKSNQHYQHIRFALLMCRDKELAKYSTIYKKLVNNEYKMDTKPIFKHILDFIGYTEFAYSKCLLSEKQIDALNKYDVVDVRKDNGQFVACKLMTKNGRVHRWNTKKASKGPYFMFTPMDNKWDSVSIPATKVICRIAKGYSISKRQMHRLMDLEIGDFVDVNPVYNGHEGWKRGIITQVLEPGEVRVKYDIIQNGEDTSYWIHRDNEVEIRYCSNIPYKTIAEKKAKLEHLFNGYVRELHINQSMVNEILTICRRYYDYPKDGTLIIKEGKKKCLESEYEYEFDKVILESRSKLCVSKEGKLLIRSWTDIHIKEEASIDVTGCGHKRAKYGDTKEGGDGIGGGRSCSRKCGAGYGTFGDSYNEKDKLFGKCYGDKYLNVLYLGSGAGHKRSGCNYYGGDGGGAIKLICNDLILDKKGIIIANGGNGEGGAQDYGGGGSGGSIHLIIKNKFIVDYYKSNNESENIIISAKGGVVGGGDGRIRIDTHSHNVSQQMLQRIYPIPYLG